MLTKHQRRSKIQEARAARGYSGSLTSGSGNGWIRKGDVRTEFEMFELKTTTKSRYPLDTKELRKLWDQAILDDKIPVFEIEFAEDKMTVVVLDKNDYVTLRQIAKYAGSYDSEGETK